MAEDSELEKLAQEVAKEPLHDVLLGEALKRCVERIVKSGTIEDALQKALEKTVADVLTSQLTSYSDFGKRLKEAVEKSLQFAPALDLPSYNHAIIEYVRRQLEAKTNAVLQQQVAEQLNELLQPAPEKIKLSQLVEQYREYLAERAREDCTCDGEGRKTIDVMWENNRHNSQEFSTLCLSAEPARDYLGTHKARGEFDHDIRIGFHETMESRKGREADPSANRFATVYHLAYNNEDIEKKMFAGPFYGFDRSLFQMKAGKTVVELDCNPEECELTYGREYDD